MCPCGSNKKYKKCCIDNPSISYQDIELSQDCQNKAFQKKIKSSPMWEDMLKKFGKEKAELLLKECKMETFES